ncbi:MAG: serine/threonine-protein kinase [Planctomycetota bacterium]|nr:serine/threonine-protein kinase [Planctomycetota bacterium]
MTPSPSDAADHSDPEDLSDPASDPLVGTRLDAYQIESVLGRGGYSVVYRARQVSLDREVALKVLTTDKAGVIEEQVEAFLNEARIGAKLDHPCLLNIYDVVQAEGKYGLAMELVEGGDLARRIKRSGPVPWQEAIPILQDVTRALQFAHSHGYTHRDVKPANVLLTGEGGARLADLGLTDTTSHAGTAAFMAPEQILRRKTGKRTDLYALGCTAFAMLTGRAPFTGGGQSKAMLKEHVHELPLLINHFGVDVPSALENLIDTMLEKQPNDRPNNASEVLEVLDGIDLDAPAEPVKLRSRRSRHHRKRGTSAGSTILVLILILAVVVGAMYIWRQFR